MMSPLSRSNSRFVGSDFAEEFDERGFGFAGGWLGAVRGWSAAGAGVPGSWNFSLAALERLVAARLCGRSRTISHLLDFRGDAGGIRVGHRLAGFCGSSEDTRRHFPE